MNQTINKMFTNFGLFVVLTIAWTLIGFMLYLIRKYLDNQDKMK